MLCEWTRKNTQHAAVWINRENQAKGRNGLTTAEKNFDNSRKKLGNGSNVDCIGPQHREDFIPNPS